MTIKVCFATGIHNEFGNEGSLPWGFNHPHSKEDFKAFVDFTKDCILVMGKHTFASLPKRLPNRTNIVLGRENLTAKNGDSADVYVRNLNVTLEKYCNILSKFYEKDVCIIGGAKLVRESLDFADIIQYTRFHNRAGYFHDVAMPLLPKYMGDVTKYESHGSHDMFMDITTYKRSK